MDIIWFKIGQQYLQVTLNIFDNIIKSNNSFTLILNEDFTEKDLYNHTRFNTSYVMLPMLFCLYQGIELMLKGFVCSKKLKNYRHKTESILEDFKKIYPNETKLHELFDQLINKPLEFIRQYRNINGITDIMQLYNSFRYPDSASKRYKYQELYYPNNESFLPQINVLKEKIESIFQYSVELFRRLESDIDMK